MLAIMMITSLSLIGAYADECNTITESVFIEGSDGWIGSFGTFGIQNGCAKLFPAPDTNDRSSYFIAPVHVSFDKIFV